MNSNKDMSGTTSGPRLTFIIWGVLVLTVFIYGAAAHFVAGRESDLEVNMALVKQLQLAFAICSFVIAAGVPILHKKLLGEKDPLDPTGLNAHLIAWALFEMVAVFGLVLTTLGRDFNLFLPFGAASVLLLFYHRPKKNPAH